MESVDAIVIGAGQGGDPLARAMAAAGKKTILIERKQVGGTCVNTGCTPTKTLYNSARVAYLARRSKDFGVETGDVRIDMPAVHKRVHDLVESFRESTEKNLESTENLELVYGHGRLSGPHSVIVADREFTAPWIVLDPGARAFVPEIPGLAETPFLDNGSILDLQRVPEHLVILGAGYIGLEFAQMFRRLGSRVTIIDRNCQLLPREDKDVAEAVSKVLEEDGIDLLLGEKVVNVEAPANVRLVSGATVEGSDLLVAIGRTPNTGDLGLENAGVDVDDKGHIKVDERLETSAKGIYAIGDAKGGPAFTHISYDDFRILEANLLNGGSRTTRDRLTPYVMYLDPQLGRVGPTEGELRQKGQKFRVAKIDADAIARTSEMSETRGFVKALVDPDSGMVLSATTFCVEGGELLACLQIAMMAGLHHEKLCEGIFAHPTLAEGLNRLFFGLKS